MNAATPTSTLRWDGPVPPVSLAVWLINLSRVSAAQAAAGSVGFGEEAGVLHQAFVQLLRIGDPFGVFVTRHEGRVESAVGHQLFPLGRLTNFLEQVDVIGNLVLGD